MSSCAPKLGKTVQSFSAPARAINRVFLHCTASSNKNVTAETINSWHLDNGWSCIGYHYYIDSYGKLVYGRDIERTPAAQSGHNESTIAICLNGLVVSDFSEAQFNTLRWLCDQIVRELPRVTFHGHCEVAAKECPVFDYKAVLGLDSAGYMPTDGAPPAPVPVPVETWTLKIARTAVGQNLQPRHPHVALAQGLLHAHGHDCGAVDGIAGPKFDSATRSFQSANGLAVDGVVAEQTWAMLEESGP